MVPQFINMYARKIKVQSQIGMMLRNILIIMPMNLLGIFFKKLDIKFETLYGVICF